MKFEYFRLNKNIFLCRNKDTSNVICIKFYQTGKELYGCTLRQQVKRQGGSHYKILLNKME
jgi:hypothetical protein